MNQIFLSIAATGMLFAIAGNQSEKYRAAKFEANYSITIQRDGKDFLKLDGTGPGAAAAFQSVPCTNSRTNT